MKYVMVGKIIGTHGIRGEVKVLSDSDFKAERFKVGSTCYLKTQEGMLPIKIDSYRRHKGLELISFNGINNINDVLKYLETEVYADMEENPGTLNPDEFHYQDLIGLEAFLESDEKIGEITDIIEVPQGSLLVLEKADGTEALVPFVREFIKTVDLENRKLIITPIEGLL
ncbi:MAG TPA: ribosome maturation factor RimM [Acholeplasmataceae bacterium]|jgi:16S rRNA processing protein RimM|nr:ribosome maturation factor RimM [Acholeplasmataceae bacterium]